jgi:hypothetical protein
MMPTQFVYFPINNRKDKRRSVYRSFFAPTTGVGRDYDNDTKYSPKTYLKGRYNSQYAYEFNPDYHLNYYYDFSPLTSLSQKYIERFAPKTTFVYYDRFSPLDDERLHYEPKQFSRFKPQVVLISNADTLDNYYNYVVKLLKAIR